MTTSLTLAPTDEFQALIEYPESDGKPMAETDKHRDQVANLIDMLRWCFRHRHDVYVSGNLFIYYEEGKPSAVFAPDVFVVFGVPAYDRRTFKLWEENKKAPDIVFEISSASTSLEDEGSKKVLCRRLGVREYFLFDPDGEYLEPRLQGFRLVNKQYVPITPDPEEGVYSQVLNLYLQVERDQLRLIEAQTGQHLLTTHEERHARYQAEEELGRLRAEIERLKQLK